MHPKNRCFCKVDPNDAAAVEAHLKTCEKRPETFDYCACVVDQSEKEEVKAHSQSCGLIPPSAAVLVRHAEHAASEEVDRCFVCSISTGELAAIKSEALTPVKGVEDRYACPAHSDCYFAPSNYWNEGVRRDEEHRVVSRDQATGEIIDPGAREVVRSSYEEKANEETGEQGG